jgi:hypothetical protein
MAIHAISLIKNEIDIVETTLSAAARWCDHIYVFDNGSTDGTWEKVQEMAKHFPAIVPWKQDPKPFRDSLRAEAFRRFRDRARRGDWWCILDADEIYIDNPAEFLALVPDTYRSVWPQLYCYAFTDRDAEEYDRDPEAYEKVPAPHRLRYYVLNEYSEPRFFRHAWEAMSKPASHRHPVFPHRVRLRHYGYRSPRQIARRLETRLEPMLRGEFIHEKRSAWEKEGLVVPGPAAPCDLPGGWRERVVPSSDCLLDTGVDSLLPALPWDWELLVSSPLRDRSAASRLRRLSQRVARSVSLSPMLDRLSGLR